ERIVAAMDSPLLKARLHANLAKTHIAADELVDARRENNLARSLMRGEGQQGWMPFINGMESQIALASNRIDDARDAIERTFADQEISQTPAPFRDFHETAVAIYQQTGDDALALAHLTALKRLDDEAAALSASANNAILAAEFDFANQELEITNLRASQLEQQIAASEERAKINFRITVGILIAAGIIIALILFALRTVSRRRREVGAANVELEKSNADLEKALAAKSEFLATTSHEIRTPLNGILGMTQIMLADGAMSSDVRERVELVHGAGSTMKAIVDDILDVAKMESGTVTIRREPFALRTALTEVARIFADQAEANGVSFILDLDACPEQAIGDQQRVRQIVLNLISNAVKFTRAGSITVTARPGAEDCDDLIVTVADTGIGIPADEVGLIFDPFHQVDGSRTRNFSGTGLGLTISCELAKAMHGELTVHSIEDRGSTFTLSLPLSLEIANAANPRAEPKAGRHRAIAFAPNALVGMIAARALPDIALDTHETIDAAIAAAMAAGSVPLVAAFGTSGTAADVEALATLRQSHPEIAVFAAGWPADAPQDPADLCTCHVDTVPALAQLADRLSVGDPVSYGRRDEVLVNRR
ncbi:MAG: ATP-binding protein, partial [Pacificimonas sp.]